MKQTKERTGVVISDKMAKTVTVKLVRRVPHSMYNKIIISTSTVKAHDEKNIAKTGDTVRIVETRPLSKTKRWRLIEVVDKTRKQ